VNQLVAEINAFIEDIQKDVEYKNRARNYYELHYQPNAIAKQVISAISRASF
jgi:hypothetical protein